MQRRLIPSARLLQQVRNVDRSGGCFRKRQTWFWSSLEGSSLSGRRLYSAQPLLATTSKVTPTVPEALASNDITLRTFELASRILPVEEYNEWASVLDRVQSGSSRRCIGYLRNYGGRSRDMDLLAALLADPLTEVDTLDALRKRVYRSNEVTLSYGPEVSQQPGYLRLPSSKLQEWDVIVLETSSPKSLFTTDIAVIPTRDPPSSTYLSMHPHTIQVQDVPGGSSSTVEGVVAVDSEEAVRALQAFRKGSVSDFQRLYLRSNMSQMQSALSEAIKSNTGDRTSRINALLLALLEDCSVGLNHTKQQLRHAEDAVSTQRRSIDVAIHDLRQKFDLIPVEESCKRGELVFEESIQALKWWKFWELDSVMESVRTAIFTTYAAEVEQKLAFFTGSVAAKQEDVERSSKDFVSGLPSVVKTAVLLNDVERIQRRSDKVASDGLTGAVQHRRHQLAGIAQPVLERKTWMSLVQGTSVAGIFFSGHLGALTYAPDLTETTVWLLAFGPLLGLRWIVGSWERAKKKWQRDVERVSQGLKADVDAKLKNLLVNTISRKSLQVAECVESGIKSRRQTVEVLQNEVGALRLELTRSSQK